MFTFSVVRSFEDTVNLLAIALDPGKTSLNTQPPEDQLFGGICSPVPAFSGSIVSEDAGGDPIAYSTGNGPDAWLTVARAAIAAAFCSWPARAAERQDPYPDPPSPTLRANH
jgi:hypothetical protein